MDEQSCHSGMNSFNWRFVCTLDKIMVFFIQPNIHIYSAVKY